jgi:hypothetical protein
MNAWFRAIALGVVLSVSTSPVWAQNAKNPIQVALLRWYQGNTVASFSTCSKPGSVAFDGLHIWTTCYGANTLEEFRASDGAVIAEITPVFAGTEASLTLSNILFDGANVWVSGDSNVNGAPGAVAKINVASANELAMQSNSNPPTVSCSSLMSLNPPACSYVTAGVGVTPFALAFDGTNVWVTNYASNTLTKIPASGTTGTSVTLAAACTGPIGIASDSNVQPNIWVACNSSNSVEVLLNGSTQTPVSGSFTGVGILAYDGTNIWVAGSGTQMYEIYPSGSTYSSISFSLSSGTAGAMSYDGKYMWIASSPIVKLLPQTANGKPTAPLPVATFTSGTSPTGIAFDGGNVWVANAGSNTLSKF